MDVTERAAQELERVVAELERCRADHRRVETLLAAVLEHIPLAVVVLDERGIVRAASAAASERWGVALDAPAPSLPDRVGSAALDDDLRIVWEVEPAG